MVLLYQHEQPHTYLLSLIEHIPGTALFVGTAAVNVLLYAHSSMHHVRWCSGTTLAGNIIAFSFYIRLQTVLYYRPE